MGESMTLSETTAWCEQRIWSSMPDKETVYANILSAYHLRQDDAYAAVGMVRGQYKRQMPEYANDSWCEPVSDFMRFVNCGVARGILPCWWCADHQRRAAQALSLLGYDLISSEEPVDFLRAYGAREGTVVVKQLRDLGDLFEGDAPWGHCTDRDHQEQRRPATGRRDGDQVCRRCRAGVEVATWQGLFSFTCPYCKYTAPCPKCGAVLENGRCSACAFEPRLYVRINTGDPEVAERAAR